MIPQIYSINIANNSFGLNFFINFSEKQIQPTNYFSNHYTHIRNKKDLFTLKRRFEIQKNTHQKFLEYSQNAFSHTLFYSYF